MIEESIDLYDEPATLESLALLIPDADIVTSREWRRGDRRLRIRVDVGIQPVFIRLMSGVALNWHQLLWRDAFVDNYRDRPLNRDVLRTIEVFAVQRMRRANTPRSKKAWRRLAEATRP